MKNRGFLAKRLTPLLLFGLVSIAISKSISFLVLCIFRKSIIFQQPFRSKFLLKNIKPCVVIGTREAPITVSCFSGLGGTHDKRPERPSSPGQILVRNRRRNCRSPSEKVSEHFSEGSLHKNSLFLLIYGVYYGRIFLKLVTFIEFLDPPFGHFVVCGNPHVLELLKIVQKCPKNKSCIGSATYKVVSSIDEYQWPYASLAIIRIKC